MSSDGVTPGTSVARKARRERPARGRRASTSLLPQLLAAAVELGPEREALRFEGRSLSYAELDEQSSRLARLLIAGGMGPEDRVAISIPRSIESVLALWAVAKSGAAFVPVDPNYPADRVAYMISDSGVSVGLTTKGARAGLTDSVGWISIDASDTVESLAAVSGAPVTYDERVRTLREQHAAYVIYTSGSTGRPKGVVVSHSGLASCSESKFACCRSTAIRGFCTSRLQASTYRSSNYSRRSGWRRHGDCPIEHLRWARASRADQDRASDACRRYSFGARIGGSIWTRRCCCRRGRG